MGFKDLKHRTQFTSTVKKELYSAIKEMSTVTQVPISRLMDVALTEFLEKRKPQ